MRVFGCFLMLFWGLTAGVAQRIDFSLAVPVDGGVNSEYEELSPILSADGQTLFFVRAFHPGNIGGQYGGMDIWSSKWDPATGWQAPTNKLGKWNNPGNNVVVGVNKDGKTVYLTDSYKGQGGIQFSKLINGQWSEPERVPIKGIRKDLLGFYMHPDFDVLLISMEGKDSNGLEDLYVCTKDSLGKWNEPQNLGQTINTSGFEISPFLSADKNRIFFASNGHGGLGDADIFMAERQYGSWTVWSKPRNLGPVVNSDKFDAYFALYDSVCYFSSNRGGKMSDIYKAKVEMRSSDRYRDSIELIVREAKKMLNDLRASSSLGQPQSYESIAFGANSPALTPKAKTQVGDLLKKYDGSTVRNIEIVTYSRDTNDNSKNYSLSLDRTRNVMEYLMSRGVVPEKCVSTILTEDSRNLFNGRSGVEVRVYLANN